MPYVLILDDDPAIANLVSLTLRLENITTRSVTTVADAIAAMIIECPDLVVLDMMVPNLDPQDFIRRVRNCDPTIPIVVCTALTRDIELDIQGIIRKPFMPEALAQQVKGLLAGKEPPPR